MRKSNYEKYPATIVNGEVTKYWDSIIRQLKTLVNTTFTIAVECYQGVHKAEIIKAFQTMNPTVLYTMDELYKSAEEIERMTAPILTDDVLFGHKTYLDLTDYLDSPKIAEAQAKIDAAKELSIVIGTGAALVLPDADLVIYIDMARWEIIQRFRRNEINGIGVESKHEPVSIQYKRGYFNDWVICDKHKRDTFHKVDYWIDTHLPEQPKMISQAVFMAGIEATIATPFRVVPFFDPAPWGGQWMKDVCDLDRDKPNFGWCFDCVPEENSLLFRVDGEIFELPSNDLVFLKSKELLGEAVEGRFGKDFPIRFDFLDTYDGGNLSLQVHPTTQYVRDTFGIAYTQDESYYLLDAEEDGIVYLGLKENINPDEMIDELRQAQKGGTMFDAEKYVNKFPAKKHDHFLIPGGTIHCSGKNAMVLEISSTPNIFTFKLWDWARLGLDGKPRPINIEHGKNVINWTRDTSYAENHLVNNVERITEGDGYVEEKTGLHPAEFIETRRHWFTKKVLHNTNGSVNVLNVIEGSEMLVESPTNAFAPFVVHYAETFIVPASIGEYTITPVGDTEKETFGTIKAYVRF